MKKIYRVASRAWGTVIRVEADSEREAIEKALPSFAGLEDDLRIVRSSLFAHDVTNARLVPVFAFESGWEVKHYVVADSAEDWEQNRA